jgi:hypothetical protein
MEAVHKTKDQHPRNPYEGVIFALLTTRYNRAVNAIKLRSK